MVNIDKYKVLVKIDTKMFMKICEKNVFVQKNQILKFEQGFNFTFMFQWWFEPDSDDDGLDGEVNPRTLQVKVIPRQPRLLSFCGPL